MATVAIIGAGIAGLACGRALDAAGFSVTLLDKARGPGGRMSTRRSGARRYDHGAQYFTVRDPDFRAAVDAWEDAGLVAPWQARLATLRGGVLTPRPAAHPRYVGTPRMSALTRALSDGLALRTSTRIARVTPRGGGLALVDTEGADQGTFDQVVVATPAAQAAPLLAAAPRLAAAAARAEMDPCLTAMVTVSPAVALPVDGVWIEDSPLAWAARDSSKPGRPDEDCWVLQATHAWSVANLEQSKPEIAERLWAAFCAALGHSPGERQESVGHRWRFAIPRGPFPDEPLRSPEVGLSACGDWCTGPRVEAAWCSGHHLARAIITG